MKSMRLRLVLVGVAAVMAVLAKGEDETVGVMTVTTINNSTIKYCDTTQKTKCECSNNAGDPANSCVQLNLSLGRPRYSALTESVMLQLNELTPNSALYSPNGFKVVAGFALRSVSRTRNASDVPKYVAITHPSGVTVDFVFSDNESVGMPQATLDRNGDGRLVMVDAEGWATASDPAFYDFYPGDGSRWRFGAVQGASDYMQFVEHQTPQGRTETAQDMGLEVIRDAGGVLRQVRSAAWFADFVIRGQDSYDLSIYPNDASCVSGTRTAEGWFALAEGAVADVVWEFRNPNPGTPRDLRVTKKRGSVSETWLYTYVEAVRDFTLVYPQGVKTDRLERSYSDDDTSFSIKRSVVGADGGVARSEEKRYSNSSQGSLLTSTVRDPGGLNLTTAYSYYSGGALDRLEKMTVYEDGSWVRFEYDGACRVTAEIRPWLDAPTNAPNNQCAVTRTGYSLFAPGDFLAYNDQRPRTEIKEICGVEVSRTYRAYPTNALGQAQEIEERTAFQGAPYGHASNPRTVKTYYSASAALPLPGRLASVVYPGGKTESYGYEYGTFNASTFVFIPDPNGGAWRETVTTSYGGNSGVQALRSARVWDEKGREVLDESYVEDGAAFALTGWKRFSYNVDGRLVETAYSDGRVVSATWGANCCGKESETSAEGVVTVYGYNELKQKVSETKKGMDADGSGDIATLYTYDLENRVLSAAVTNTASGLGYVASRSAYDAGGRVTNATDRLGNATATAYVPLAVTIFNPNGVTNHTERYLDGKTKRVLENGVVRQSYAYGVSADGVRWTLSANGAFPGAEAVKTVAELRALASALDCPWTLVFQNSLGQPAVSMRPGFGRTVLVTSNACDAAGNLLSGVETSCRPDGTGVERVKSQLYAYAADGSRLFSALDLNTNGVIDAAGPDRIDGTAAVYEKAGADWWRVTRSWVYPEFNSSAAVTTSVQRVRLTGLGVQQGGDGVLVSHTERLDVRGNATVSETLVDRADRKVTRGKVLPTSVQPEIQITGNGLLLKTVSSTSVTNTFGYDALARQTAVTDGRGNTTITVYKALGQVDYTEDAATNRTTYAYDVLGRQTAVTDALGNVTHTAYDVEGRVAKTWGAIYPVEYGYDAQGRRVSMKTFRDENGVGDETRWLYDQPTGLLTNKLYADGKGPAYIYTSDGRLTTRTWARGITTAYAYDAAGSLATVDYSDATPNVFYTYNRLGNQISTITFLSTNLFIYSPETLELVSETQNGAIITRATDTFGRASGISLGDDYGVTYGYDAFGRFVSVSSSVYSAVSTANYSYLPNSDLLVGCSAGPLTATKTYEPHRDLVTQGRNETVAGVVSQYDYMNDAIGRRTLRSDSGLAFAQSQTNAFGYNARSEVTSAVMCTNAYGYVYDSVGNRLFSFANSETNRYVANSLNQYSNITYQSNSPPTYDSDGNMTTTGDGWHYVWNGENRMSIASNDDHVVSYEYDHIGRMIRKAVDGTATKYVWDGFNIIAEARDTTGATKTTYNVWGLDLSGTLKTAGGVGGLLAVTVSNSSQPSTFYPCYDANGNVTEYVSNDGTLAVHREYDAFGNTISETLANLGTNEPVAFAYWWSTKPWCRVTGLSEYQFRQYNSKLGRWLSRDLLEERGGQNLYGFVFNRPVNAIDVKGNCSPTIIGAGAFVVVARVVIAVYILRYAIETVYRITEERTVTYQNYKDECNQCKADGVETKPETRTRTEWEYKRIDCYDAYVSCVSGGATAGNGYPILDCGTCLLECVSGGGLWPQYKCCLK